MSEEVEDEFLGEIDSNGMGDLGDATANELLVSGVKPATHTHAHTPANYQGRKNTLRDNNSLEKYHSEMDTFFIK